MVSRVVGDVQRPDERRSILQSNFVVYSKIYQAHTNFCQMNLPILPSTEKAKFKILFHHDFPSTALVVYYTD